MTELKKPLVEAHHTKILRIAFAVPAGLPKEFDRLLAVLNSQQSCDAEELLEDIHERMLSMAEHQMPD